MVKTLDCSFLHNEVQTIILKNFMTIRVSIIIDASPITLHWGSLYKLLQVIVDASTLCSQAIISLSIITNTLIGATIACGLC